MVRYPAYTGNEACASIGVEMFYPENGDTHGINLIRKFMREHCYVCPVYSDCLEWALHREHHGFWADTSTEDRKAIRRKRNIHIEAPEYRLTRSFE